MVYVFSNLRLIDKLVDGKEKQCPWVDDVEAGEEEEEGDIEGEELEVNEDDEMEPSQELDPNEFGLAAMEEEEEEEEEGGGRRVSRRTSRGGRGAARGEGRGHEGPSEAEKLAQILIGDRAFEPDARRICLPKRYQH